MNRDEAERAIRAEIARADPAGKYFWKGVLVGLACGVNLNFELMRDLANAQGTGREPAAHP